MNQSSKKPKKQNPFLKFFRIISLQLSRLPKKTKRNTVVVCSVLIVVGIIISAVCAPGVSVSSASDEKNTQDATQPTTVKPVVEKKHQIKGIPIVVQDYYKAGCETYACTMLLQGLGYDIDEHEFVDNYLIRRDMSYDENGTMYGPDMNSAFAGDIFTGHGINSPAMAKSMNQYLKTQKTDNRAYSVKGKTLAELCDIYISHDIPVMTWVTTYMEESYERFSWVVDYVDENAEYKIGDEVAWRQNEHCMVLIGYNEKEYIFCDSVAGKVVSHDKALAETRFKEIGNQAVVVKNTFLF